MKELDLHGKKVADAEADFFGFLNNARLKNKLEVVCFITGAGVIRERLLALAQEHELYHYVPLANRGCVVIEFE